MEGKKCAKATVGVPFDTQTRWYSLEPVQQLLFVIFHLRVSLIF